MKKLVLFIVISFLSVCSYSATRSKIYHNPVNKDGGYAWDRCGSLYKYSEAGVDIDELYSMAKIKVLNTGVQIKVHGGYTKDGTFVGEDDNVLRTFILRDAGLYSVYVRGYKINIWVANNKSREEDRIREKKRLAEEVEIQKAKKLYEEQELKREQKEKERIDSCKKALHLQISKENGYLDTLYNK